MYPEGELQPYKDECVLQKLNSQLRLASDLSDDSNAWRITSEEKRYDEKLAMEDPETTYQHIRRAAEVHRLVRRHARKTIRPGMTMTEIAENIEDGTRALVEANGFESGVGFPTGLSLNHCAAHYSPNAGDTKGGSFCDLLLSCSLISQPRAVLQQGDVLKVDFGVHVNGRIVDSAFTMNFEPTYDKLLEAVKAATDTGIRVSVFSQNLLIALIDLHLQEAGIDVRLGELGAAIQETMESYEVEVNGKVYPGVFMCPYIIYALLKASFSQAYRKS